MRLQLSFDIPRLLLLEDYGYPGSKELVQRLENTPFCWVARGSALIKNQVEGYTQENLTGCNEHVRYIHTKFMIVDPMTDNPKVCVQHGEASGACSSVVERSLSMREVLGSMPSSSIF